MVIEQQDKRFLFFIMLCVKCHKNQTYVIDSREEEDSIRRRRQCPNCGLRFTTYERTEATNLRVIKKNGIREVFERDKVLHGMIKACEKRNIKEEDIEQAVARIESKLSEKGEKEIPSKIIGELVMKELKQIDKVAYIRFASVYRDFTDVESFEKEIHKILKK